MKTPRRVPTEDTQIHSPMRRHTTPAIVPPVLLLALCAAATGAPPGFGPLKPDPKHIFDLPEGFSYTVVSSPGMKLDDGLTLPGAPDGMAAFAGPDGLTIVIRNHEVDRKGGPSAFGPDGKLLAEIDPAKVYDATGWNGPSKGGVSTFVYDTREQKLVRQFMSLLGTDRNCAGGPTPRGTWLSCEETFVGTEQGYGKDHGWVFEIPATDQPGLVDPVPLRALGRRNHEGGATDPETGVVYLTEDTGDSLIYRFLPDDPDDLTAGGQLQALAIKGHTQFDTRNWDEQTVKVGESLACEWIECEDVASPKDDLRKRGFEAGAARFARGEGMWYGNGSVYFTCTSGGPARCGQVWRHTPGADPSDGGTLELFVQSPGREVLDYPDNMTVAPWGDLVLCEDGDGEQFLRGVTADGQIYNLGRNALSKSEITGACFSPDGTTLFLNLQWNGLTLAITGPWPDAE